MTQELYFRTRPGAATVFRVGETGSRRIDMTQIATVNLKNGAIKPAANNAPTAEEDAQISDWTTARAAAEAASRRAEAETLADTMGAVTHWLRSEATPEDVAAIERRLLLAMHDLRRTLIRKSG